MFDTEASYIQNKWAQQSKQRIAIDSIQQKHPLNLFRQDRSDLKPIINTQSFKNPLKLEYILKLGERVRYTV